jgi:hypothetical protein
MPINGTGGWSNWTTPSAASMSANGIGSIPLNLAQNLPWFFPFLVALCYVAMFIIFRERPGRFKYIANTFVPLVVSWIMESFGWLPNYASLSGTNPVTDICLAIFIITVGMVFLTGG